MDTTVIENSLIAIEEQIQAIRDAIGGSTPEAAPDSTVGAMATPPAPPGGKNQSVQAFLGA